MEETTTDETQPESTGAEPQVEATEQTAAEPTQATETEPSADDNVEWLKSKGIEPDDPQAMSKVADMYRNAERQMHKVSQEKNQLHSATQEAAAGDETAELKSSVQVLQFYTFHPEARDLDAEMAQIVQDKPWLAQDLETVLTLAKTTQVAGHEKEVEAKIRERVKAELSRSSVAGTPKGNATAAREDKTDDESRLERFSDWK